MLFVVSSRVTPDVAAEVGRISKQFETEIVRMLASVEITSPLTGIVLFPTILNPNTALMADNVTYKKGDGSVFVALGTLHVKWVKASPAERIDLIADNICISLTMIKDTRLLPGDRAKLLGFTEMARQTLQKAVETGARS